MRGSRMPSSARKASHQECKWKQLFKRSRVRSEGHGHGRGHGHGHGHSRSARKRNLDDDDDSDSEILRTRRKKRRVFNIMSSEDEGVAVPGEKSEKTGEGRKSQAEEEETRRVEGSRCPSEGHKGKGEVAARRAHGSLSFEHRCWLKFEKSVQGKAREAHRKRAGDDKARCRGGAHEGGGDAPECDVKGKLGEYMRYLCDGYSALLHVFRFLSVRELACTSRVCRMWHGVASQPVLWRSVRLEHTTIRDWDAFAAVLSRRGTERLDVRGMGHVRGEAEATWDGMCSAVGNMSSLRKLHLWKCPQAVVERVVATCPQLQSLSVDSMPGPVHVSVVAVLKDLEGLRLRGGNGARLVGGLQGLQSLGKLKHVSLTNMGDLGEGTAAAIASLRALESLEVGPLPGPYFGKLRTLKRLRLEWGCGVQCPAADVLAALVSLPLLATLEMVNCDVRPGFDEALAQCVSVRRLLVIPAYKERLAATNQLMLRGVMGLARSLHYVAWGLTHEMLCVTRMFRRMLGVKASDPGMNAIPVLRPVPGLGDTAAKRVPGTALVHILSIPQLRHILATILPSTRVKLFPVPFRMTACQHLDEVIP